MKSKDVTFRRTLLASAISLAFAGASGFAVAAQTDSYDASSQTTTTEQESTATAPQQDPMAQDPMADEQTAMAPGQISEQEAEQLIGQPLMSAEGEELGDIERVVRDDQDRLALVVSEQGTLGIGGSERVVELEQIEVQGQQATLSQGDLAAMPEFQEEQYETVASAEEAASTSSMPPEETAELEQQQQSDQWSSQ